MRHVVSRVSCRFETFWAISPDRWSRDLVSTNLASDANAYIRVRKDKGPPVVAGEPFSFETGWTLRLSGGGHKDSQRVSGLGEKKSLD